MNSQGPSRRRWWPLVPWLAACAATAPDANEPRTLSLPARRDGAPTGSELVRALANAPLAERERRLAAELAAGNVPSFLRRLVPVQLDAAIDGRVRRATVWVTPDYLGLGADDDWLRTPMTPGLAQHCADALGCLLPTRRVVDAVWQQADLQLAPRPFDPREHDICAFGLFGRHHAEIERQRARAGGDQGRLVAGIKKDVVVSPLVVDWPDRVFIYGWHRQDGRAIQPLSKVHTWPHVDYSHGARLVLRDMLVDGAPTTVDAVLADPVLCALLSDEGPIAAPRYRRTGG